MRIIISMLVSILMMVFLFIFIGLIVSFIRYDLSVLTNIYPFDGEFYRILFGGSILLTPCVYYVGEDFI